ncbi:MAG: protein kinase [Planctomycetota bacterium]
MTLPDDSETIQEGAEHLTKGVHQDLDGTRAGAEGSGSAEFSLAIASSRSGENPRTRSSPPKLPEQIGDYRIGTVIGSGGMGHVYRAEHVRMQRVVAVKVLPAESIGDRASIDRFYAEVRAAAKLMHPNIVTALDAGEQEGIHYLVMEYIDGVTLAQWVGRGGPLSVGSAASVIRQAAMGLLHAHRAGLVHRDVKPGNLMRSSDSTIKVLDLGLARIHRFNDPKPSDAPDKRRHLIGTLPYMAPEQLENAEGADPRSDIYSLGATLHYLLTGQSPYTGEYLDQVYGHRHGEIPDLMSARDDIDLNFANIFERMMAKSPDARYASLDEVIEDLAPYATNADAPAWLTEFTSKQPFGENSAFSSAFSSVSSEHTIDAVMGIEMGMMHAAAARCDPAGMTDTLSILPQSSVGGSALSRSTLRCVIAWDQSGICFGDAAMRRRAIDPSSVIHCLPMYLGRRTVPREIEGVKCPPEALLGLTLSHILRSAWPHEEIPQAIAMTTLATYDQMHRRCLMTAAQIAGLTSVRLIDRSLACGTAVIAGLAVATADVKLGGESSLVGLAQPKPAARRRMLFIGMSGQGTEVATLVIRDGRLRQEMTGGHWKNNALNWLHRLVDLVAERFLAEHGIDLKRNLAQATLLQIACEKALLPMAVLPVATVTVGQYRVQVDRQAWLDRCDDLLRKLRSTVLSTLRAANLSFRDIDDVLTFGPILRISAVREAVLKGFDANIPITPVSRDQAARGAALCLSAQLPGRSGHPTPPRSVASQTLGLVIMDKRNRRRILPVIQRGTTLPARVNRRVTAPREKPSMSITVAESSAVDQKSWQTLGKNQVEMAEDPSGSVSRTVSFELDINGLLSLRIQESGGPGSRRLPTLPPPNLDEAEILAWRRWVDSHR